jgi:hypothetical protein
VRAISLAIDGPEAGILALAATEAEGVESGRERESWGQARSARERVQGWHGSSDTVPVQRRAIDVA